MEDFGFLLTKMFARTKETRAEWPRIPGKYFVVDPDAPVAVTTLGSIALAKEVGARAPRGLCIVGKVETENIGIEKIIKNILANPAIRCLVLAGAEPPKHLTGASFLALFDHGVDDGMRIIGAPGMRPVLPNTSTEEVTALRDRIEVVNMIGDTDIEDIVSTVVRVAGQKATVTRSTRVSAPAGPLSSATPPSEQPSVQQVLASGEDPEDIKLDQAGYFVIQVKNDTLLVEHYDYKNALVRVVKGSDARSIYLTLTRNEWVTRTDHAAYLGKELARAEFSMREGIEYVQDGA